MIIFVGKIIIFFAITKIKQSKSLVLYEHLTFVKI